MIEIMKLDSAFYFFRGRTALYALLKAMDVRKGDEVISQAFTCIAVSNPIICIGAKPVYIDINPRTYNIDISKIEERITERTRVIIAQHTFGIPAEMDRMLEIGRKNNLYIIEDSCHTFASQYEGRQIGSFGDAAFFSFEWGKPVIIGLGGCAIVNDQDLKETLKSTYDSFVNPQTRETIMIHLEYVFHSLFLSPSSFWIIRDFYRYLYKLGLIVGTFNPQELKGLMNTDYEKRMSGFHKKLLMKKLNKLEDNINHRTWVASQYKRLLLEIGIKPLGFDDRYKPVYLRYPLLVKDKSKILSEARRKRIELGDWYVSPIHPLSEDQWEYVNYRKGMCPVAEDVSKSIITLPIYEKIGRKGIERTISFLENMNKCGYIR